MSHPNRNPILAAVLAACERERIAAGVRRDGCALAHIDPAAIATHRIGADCTGRFERCETLHGQFA